MPSPFSQILSVNMISDANNRLQPGQQTVLGSENDLSESIPTDALTILKDHDNTLWIELYEHNLTGKIIEVYADSVKRSILLHMDGPVSKIELLNHCGASRSSAYRKFNELLQDGFLLPVVSEESTKHVQLYDKIILKVEFSVTAKISQIRLQINLACLSKLPMDNAVYPDCDV